MTVAKPPRTEVSEPPATPETTWVTTEPPEPIRRFALWDLGAALLYTVMAAIYTWPIPLHPMTRVPENLIDPIHLSYILASQARALVSRPWDFLQATYFFPIRDGLAFSEQHVGAALIGLPAWVTTENPLFMYNFVLLASFLISALTAYWLFKEVTESRAAAFVGGIVYAFIPYRLSKTYHLHVLLLMWLPLVLLYLWRFAHSRRWKDGLKFGAVLFLQVMTGVHVAVFTAMALAAAFAFLVPAVRYEEGPRKWIRAGVVTFVSLGLAAALLWPYVRVFRDRPEHRRSVAEIQSYSGGLSGLVTAPANNRFWGPKLQEARLRQFGWEKALFPGSLPLLLGATGVVSALRPRRRDRERFDPWPPIFVSLSLLGWLLALGPRIHVFGIGGDAGILSLHGILLEAIPGFGSIRVPGRFIVLTTMGLAGLSAYGVGWILEAQRRRGCRIRTGFAIATTILVALEFLPTTALTVKAPRIPEAYRWVASQPTAPILSLPTGFIYLDVLAEWSYLAESRYLYYASAHWRPMINGFSSNVPEDYRKNIEAVADFPSEASIAYLQDLGVRYVIVHTDDLEETPWMDLSRDIETMPPTAIPARFGPDVVLDVRALDTTG